MSKPCAVSDFRTHWCIGYVEQDARQIRRLPISVQRVRNDTVQWCPFGMRRLPIIVQHVRNGTVQQCPFGISNGFRTPPKNSATATMSACKVKYVINEMWFKLFYSGFEAYFAPQHPRCWQQNTSQMQILRQRKKGRSDAMNCDVLATQIGSSSYAASMPLALTAATGTAVTADRSEN